MCYYYVCSNSTALFTWSMCIPVVTVNATKRLLIVGLFSLQLPMKSDKCHWNILYHFGILFNERCVTFNKGFIHSFPEELSDHDLLHPPTRLHWENMHLFVYFLTKIPWILQRTITLPHKRYILKIAKTMANLCCDTWWES